MKSEKGVSLVSLIIYLIAMTTVVAIVARVSTYFYKNVNSVETNIEQNEQYVKFNAYITKEISTPNNKINKIGNDGKYVIFSGTSNQYTFSNNDGAIYMNQVKICSNISNCKFEAIGNNKDKIKITLNIDGGKTYTNVYTIN